MQKTDFYICKNNTNKCSYYCLKIFAKRNRNFNCTFYLTKLC